MSYKFEKNGFVIVKGAVQEQTLKLLQCNFRMIRDCDLYNYDCSLKESKKLGDGQVKNSFGWYSAYCFESLMLVLQATVENAVSKSLFPSYTYARIMYSGADMKKHKDRPSCQYSTTICIDEDIEYPYPIFIENYEGKVSEVVLSPGDMLVYNGTELNHWRESYKGKEHIQAFLHYVDANGEYKDFKFDKRTMLGLSLDTKINNEEENKL